MSALLVIYNDGGLLSVWVGGVIAIFFNCLGYCYVCWVNTDWQERAYEIIGVRIHDFDSI